MHTSQMTESTVNLELVEALKKHSPNVLVVLALGLLGVRGWIWWSEKQAERVGDAWVAWAGVDNYASMTGIIEQYGSIGSVADMAGLTAADMRLAELYSDVSPTWVPTEVNPDDPEAAAQPLQPEVAPPMSQEERQESLDGIEAQYRAVVDRTKGDPGRELIRVKAQFGLAAVAEMRQDHDGARAIYEQIKGDLESSGHLSDLLALCEHRMQSLDGAIGWTELPT